MAKHEFEAEISQLLELITHSLYSHKEVFLRELISNATDALDKLKYLTLSDEKFKDLDTEFRIDIEFDEDGKSMIVISDTGIGMDETELINNLGTIARSGTRHFISQLKEEDRSGNSLIGQFGVGFYSSFMVAKKIEVTSRKVGDEQAWRWVCDGSASYSVTKSSRPSHGTTVTLFLNDAGKEFASRWSIEQVVEKYSNHIQFPIYLHYTETEPAKEGEEQKKTRTAKQINLSKALWRRPKSEISKEEYEQFYKSISGDADEPLMYFHTQAEGTQEYVTLFYVPKQAPYDLFQVDYSSGIKLYIQRVFITDDKRELIPVYLRFLRGIIDSEDLPLNVSREMLQENTILQNIRSAAVKRFLNEVVTVSEKDPERFTLFIEQYNKVLKEGLYADFANRETLLKIIRYKSSTVDGYTSLAAYKERMQSEQKYIYYISGASEQMLRSSPLVAGYKARSIEVLLMDDEIDDMVIHSIGNYEGLELRAVNRSGNQEEKDGKEKTEDSESTKELKGLCERIKKVLGEKVQDVTISSFLQGSPCCIVWADQDPNLRMQQIMKAMGQNMPSKSKPILELAADNKVIQNLAKKEDDEVFTDLVALLYEQAMMNEGGTPEDPVSFSSALNRVLESTIGQ